MNKISESEIQENTINLFIQSIEDTKPSEFFSFDEVYMVNEVSEAIKTSFCDDSIAYDSIPRSGFRYLYFGGFLNMIKPNSPTVNFETLKNSLEKRGYVFAADDSLLFVGVPEINFEDSYKSKFNCIFEDKFI